MDARGSRSGSPSGAIGGLMPLPESNETQKWPPESAKAALDMYAEWSSWYSSDPSQLSGFYSGSTVQKPRGPWYKFWARDRVVSEVLRVHLDRHRRASVHLPLAADIAAVSAALLFGEAPTVTIPEAHMDPADQAENESTFGEEQDTNRARAQQAENRLKDILVQGDAQSRQTEGAETCSALGGVFIKPDWDPALAPVPLLSIVQPDQALAEFRYNILTAVTLWRIVERREDVEQSTTVWRHLERHEVIRDDESELNGRGVILHGLYRGTNEKLGQRMQLSEHPETATLQDMVLLPFDGLGIRYFPNGRPNRRLRGSALGQSDYAGAEDMLNALDETMTSWVRDIRLGKARILVADSYLENRDGKFQFDLDQEIYTPLNIDPLHLNGNGIQESQFAIRYEEHEQSMLTMIEQIVSHAGYSPQSFGLRIDGRVESGTALRARERKTLMTQQRKRRHWESGLADLYFMLLALDADVFGSGVTPMRPQVTLADSLTPDEGEIAATVDILNRAGAVSDFIKVKMVHPDWEKAEIDEEVARIREDKQILMPNPFGGPNADDDDDQMGDRA